MSIPYFIAKRYTRSKSESKFVSLISIISIAGIALGVAVLVIAMAVLEGFETSVSEKIVDFNSHILITGFSQRNLPDYQEVIPQIEERVGDQLASISPFVRKLAIIKSKRISEGVTINGILPELDNSDINKFIIAGKYDLDSTGVYPNLIMGKKLADKLFLNVGDKITLFSLRNDQIPSIQNPPSIEQFIISGIYESGMSEYDDLNVYIDLNLAQEILLMGDNISGYNIRLNSLEKLEEVKENLQDLLGWPYYSRTIFDVHENIFTWIELQKEPIPLVLGLIIIVAIFNVVGTILIIVLERTNAIGILKSLGMNSKQVIKIFILQGLSLSIAGILLGNLLAFVLCKLQQVYKIISLPDTVYFISSVPISINWIHYLIVSFVALILGVIASYIPSYIASKVKPVAALKFE